MSPLKRRIAALIVDDEALARRTIRELLQADAEVEIIGECRNGREAVDFIEARVPDLIFLDIQMPGMNGFEVLANVDVSHLHAIIFVTAFDQYALRAFDVHALDYLLKPFTDARFAEALKKAKDHLELKEINQISNELVALLQGGAVREPAKAKREKFLTRFMIRSGGRAAFIKADDVDWIAADDYYIKLHVGPKSHLLRISMNDLEAQLDPTKFLRIHRSTIINFERVKELQQTPSGDYALVLKDGTELKLSRSRRESLERFLIDSD
jgi:two-component system, LytTR family, response regulator